MEIQQERLKKKENFAAAVVLTAFKWPRMKAKVGDTNVVDLHMA